MLSAAPGTAAFGAVTRGQRFFPICRKPRKLARTPKGNTSGRRSRKDEWEDTQELAQDYGQLQIKVKTVTIGRFIAFIERISQRGSMDKKFLEGLDGISVPQIKEYKAAALEAKKLAYGSVGGLP